MANLLNDLLRVDLSAGRAKPAVIGDIGDMILADGYRVVDQLLDKPWGACWRFDNRQVGQFIEQFFERLSLEQAERGVPGAELSPKILLVAPGQRLSWQYHERRAELWRSVAGTPYYYRSQTDQPGGRIDFPPGQTVQFDSGERHRLASADTWSIVAEIWQHTDQHNLSDEADIIRLADDYKR